MLQIFQNYLRINWTAQLESDFHFLWLRDNSPQFRHPNGQKLSNTLGTSLGIKPKTIQLEADTLFILWEDGLESRYLLEALRRFSFPESMPEKIRWDAESAKRLPYYRFVDVCAKQQVLRDLLQHVDVYGFGLLCEVPQSKEMLRALVALFGYIRQTNYGKTFEVKSILNPDNLADTSLALSPHTDNPYRNPVPTLQLLHCLESDTEGGETILVDGFLTAKILEEKAPEHFKLLSSIPVSFRYEDARNDFQYESTIISLDTSGKVRSIRFNDRSIQPFRLPLAQTEAFYEAYAHFESLLHAPENQFIFKLSPGELYLVDNERILHGRTAFTQSGKRLLHGCYADRDGLLSTLRKLNAMPER